MGFKLKGAKEERKCFLSLDKVTCLSNVDVQNALIIFPLL